MKSPCSTRMTLEDLTRSVHLILGVREGHGFGLLNCPLVVVAGLDGHRLETDIIPPSSDPTFAIELVWEADLKNIRRLRQANTPVKIECFSVINSQKRDRIGYILLSLKQAQIIPEGKKINVVESWHKLLGVRSEMKALNPEMLLTLRIEDHLEELTAPARVDNLIDVSKHVTTTSNTLIPLLYADEGLIQIGSKEFCNDVFKLKVSIGFPSCLKCLLPIIKQCRQSQLSDTFDQFILCYSIMGYSVQTKMNIRDLKDGNAAGRDIYSKDGVDINVRSNLKTLNSYFNEYPTITFKLLVDDMEVAATSLQLRGLINTENLLLFEKSKGTNLNAKCYLTPSPSKRLDFESFKIYIEVSVGLSYEVSRQGVGGGDTKKPGVVKSTHKYQEYGDNDSGEKSAVLETILSPRKRPPQNTETEPIPAIDFEKVASSQQQPSSPNSPQSKLVSNKDQGNYTYRCDGDYSLPHGFSLNVSLNSVIFKKLPLSGKFTFSMHHPFAEVLCSSQNEIFVESINEKICLPAVTAEFRFVSSVNEINNIIMAEQPTVIITDSANKKFATAVLHTGILLLSHKNKECAYTASLEDQSSGSKNQLGLLNVTMSLKDCGIIIKQASSEMGNTCPVIDKRVAYRVVEELEDWKERQQELFKSELKRKECQHLTMLSSEWTKRRMELEDNLNRNVEQCRTLALSLNKATDNLRERSRTNSEKERTLALAEKDLERKYELMFQELKEATARMEADVNHKMSLLKFEKTELLERLGQSDREKKRLLSNVQTLETELENMRAGGLTKEQTAGLVQEMKAVEEKLEAALESKIFFKEQWGKAVREIHRLKKEHQHSIQAQIQREREELHKIQLCQQMKEEEKQMKHDKAVLQELKSETQELSGKQQTQQQLQQQSKSQQPNQQLLHSSSGYHCITSDAEVTNTQLEKLINQRELLLNSGAVTNQEMLVALNNQIRTLLVQMTAQI
ncbi:centrosomal protein of 120 kDa-like [Lycorma delicatula]|uniref:centrosomal protein of 120 kDa-like n=1 Tax=Lycorma delicatula TaxID=130591 RepID=UPI003F51947D